MQKKGVALKNTKKRKSRLLGKYPGRTLNRIGTLLGGIWIASKLLSIIWPEPDQISSNTLFEKQVNKIKTPNHPLSIVLIGTKN